MAIQRAHIDTRLRNDLPGPLVVFAGDAEVHTNSDTLGRTNILGSFSQSMTKRHRERFRAENLLSHRNIERLAYHAARKAFGGRRREGFARNKDRIGFSEDSNAFQISQYRN